MKIAQISDLHFSHVSFSPFQFFSKRWLGNLNALFLRKHLRFQDRLNVLPSFFKELGVDHILICGDLSTTSHKKEFAKAAGLVREFEQKGMNVFSVPGNHDQYTTQAYKDMTFYDYFGSDKLKENGVSSEELGNGWWLVRIDTAIATSWVSSRGLFSLETESNLEELLSSLPSNAKVILMNHYPFFQHDSPRKTLERGRELQALIQSFPKVKLYLHGHTHRHCIADLRNSELPIILDSGSAPNGSLNLIDIDDRGVEVQVFAWENGWKQIRKVSLKW